MIQSFRVLAIIPARGGSKGLPRKNMREIAGRPLIAWTINAAKENIYIDEVVVTSDDDEIITYSKSLGVSTVLRPPELATDDALASPVILHCLRQKLNFDLIIYLQPTSPLRTSAHINNALEALVRSKKQNLIGVVSVVKTTAIPERMYRYGSNGALVGIMPSQEHGRQEIPTTYILNGAIYCAFRDPLILAEGQFGKLELWPIVMEKHDSVDIDTGTDFEEAEAEFKKRLR